MVLNQNQKLLLPVKDTRTIKDKSFYVVEHEGSDYLVRQYPFQVNQPLPKKIRCLVKNAAKKEIIQDRTELLQQLYKAGKEYPFQIRNDFTTSTPAYYELMDSNGLTTRLYNHKIHLHVGDTVSCKVNGINEKGALLVEFCSVQSAARTAPEPSSMNSKSDGQTAEPSYTDDLKHAENTFQHIVEELSRMSFSVNDNATKGIGVEEESEEDAVFYSIDYYCAFCESMIEKDYPDEPEQIIKGQALSHRLSTMECLLDAIEKYMGGYADKFVDSIVSKLNNRMFYKKEERLLTCYFILALRIGSNETVDFNTLKQILEAGLDLQQQDKELFKTLALRSVPTGLHTQISEDPTDTGLAPDTLKALALQLVLADNQPDPALAVHFMLGLLPYAGTVKEKLTDTIINYLLSGDSTSGILSWSDLADFKPQLLAGKMANMTVGEHPTGEYLYNGSGFIRLAGGKLSVSASPFDNSLKEVGCSLGTLAGKLQVLCADKIRIDDNRVPDMLDAWRRVSLQSDRKALRIVDRSGQLSEGNNVIVRLDGFLDDKVNYAFQCTVVEGGAPVSGLMPINNNMVRYYVTQADLLLKRDGLVFIPATVSGVYADGIEFSCIEQLTDQLFEQLSVGQELPCKLKSSDPNRGSVWLTENGYNIYTPYTALEVKSYGVVQVTDIAPNGYVKGELVSNSNVSFYDNEAFCRLLDTIRVYPEDSEAYKPKETSTIGQLTLDSIRTLMYLLEQKAGGISNFYEKFNIQCVLQLMAQVIGDDGLYNYYRERIRQLGLLRSYLDSGHMDMDLFFRKAQADESLYKAYPALAKTAEILSILSYMDNKAGNEKLMDLYRHAKDERAAKLSGLILAGNLLDEYDLPVDKAAIRKEVVGILNTSLPETDKSDLTVIGSEDYHTEFKTSIVYPAGNGMMQDVAEQTRHIASVIAGFLNADGGDLYIGVNNYGVPVGLKADMDFMGNADKFEISLHNTIRFELGRDVNSLLQCRWVDYDGKQVYVISVPAYHQVVYMATGDAVYARQRSSTVLLDKAAVYLLAERKRLRFGNSIAMPVVEPEAAVPGAEAVQPGGQEDSQPEKRVARKTAGTSHGYSPFCNVKDMFDQDFSLYLHYMTSDEYMITDRNISDRNICLTVPFEDDANQLVQLFSNGNIARTSLKQIAGKKLMYPYKLRNFKHTDLAGVTIADPSSQLFVAVETDGKVYGKVIDTETVTETKDICTMGKPYSSVSFDRFLACIQVPDSCVDKLGRIKENKVTNNGFLLSAETFRKEVAVLKTFVTADLFNFG